MAKYRLVMTPTPCRVAGCIISIRPTYSCADALTYLFTYIVGSGSIKPAISPQRLKIERKLLLTAYIKSYTGFRLPPKCMTLNDLCAKYSLVMTPAPCTVTGCIKSARPYVSTRALTYLFTYLHSWLGEYTCNCRQNV